MHVKTNIKLNTVFIRAHSSSRNSTIWIQSTLSSFPYMLQVRISNSLSHHHSRIICREFEWRNYHYAIFFQPPLTFSLLGPNIFRAPFYQTPFSIIVTHTKLIFKYPDILFHDGKNNGKIYYNLNTLRTGDADLCFYITNVQDGWRKSVFFFNTRWFSLHNTLNYAIHRACLRMVLLTDVYRNLTSIWINL